MRIEICKLDSNRNLAERELRWLVQAIESFSRNISRDEAITHAQNMSNAFSFYALPAYKRSRYNTHFTFKKEWIYKENQIHEGNSNPAALACFCRKDGLLYDINDKFELSNMAEALLKDAAIPASEYAFVLLSKQWIKIDGKCVINLLVLLYNLLVKDSSFIHKLYTYKEDLIGKEVFFPAICGRAFADDDIIDFNRFDILKNMMELAGLVSYNEDEPYVSNEALKVLTDFAAHSHNLTAYGDTEQDFYNYISANNFGILEVLPKTNTEIYRALYPNLVKLVSAQSHRLTHSNKFIELLEDKLNLVLTGAPGTGKTFLAQELAAQLASNGTQTWEQLRDAKDNRICFVQFHPSYDYTDFVEGLRPDKHSSFVRTDGAFKHFCKNALIGYKDFQSVYDKLVHMISSGRISSYPLARGGFNRVSVLDGKIYYHTGANTPRTENAHNLKLLFSYYVSKSVFNIENIDSKELDRLICELTNGNTKNLDSTEYKWTLSELLKIAEERCHSKYVFIIDEINRGELSKIFGELFYLIEKTYRAPKHRVKTQYNNLITDDNDPFKDGFYIPDNVYIIGTMNDIDRGVETMDFAIRRRFAWKEITVEYSAERMGLSEDAKDAMNAINGVLKEEFGSAYCIGGSYFKDFTKDQAKRYWQNHLRGIIYEYYRGESKADEKVKELAEVYCGALSIELKDIGEQDA